MFIPSIREPRGVQPLNLIRMAAAVAAVSLGAVALGQPDAAIRLEGSGKHRADCDATQFKPLNPAVLSNLSEWAGTAPTAESLKDKVVVFVTWAWWNKATHSAVKLTEQLNKKYADKGLVTIGIHNPREFGKAADSAKELGITFPYAADADGKARAALIVDADPDFFIVDRSGNMRFADVETQSVEKAVDMLIGETAEQAAAIPTKLAQASRQKEIESLKTGDTKGLVKPGQPLTVTFPEPSDDAYRNANWPKMPGETGHNEYDEMVKKIHKDYPATELPDENWAPSRPVSKGRITVVYLIDPLSNDWKAAIPVMNRVQDAYVRDVVVVCAIYQNKDKENLQGDEKEKYQASIVKSFASLRATEYMNHATVPGIVKANGVDKFISITPSMREIGIVMLISSDNRLRWVGNPHTSSFQNALTQMIREDPGVRARQKAEEAKARSEGN